MATYPPVTDRERDAALRRIRIRHERREDPHWSEAEIDATEPAYTVLAYLRKRHKALPRGLATANIWDELVLSAWVYWHQAARERELLRRARDYGLSLSDLAAFLGIGTRQGMRDYLDRTEALLDERARATETPHPPATGNGTTEPPTRPASTTRAARGADVHATRRKRREARLKPTRAEWIQTHHPIITSSLAQVLDQAARLNIYPDPSEEPAVETDKDTQHDPDEHHNASEIGLGDYLAWLTEDLDREAIDTGTFGALGLVLGELRTNPEVAALPANHGIHQAIRAADRLRAEFADLTPNHPVTPA